MRKYVFRLVMTCLAAILVVSTSFAAAGTPTQGTCGDPDASDAVKWEFNVTTGTLTISGTGAMRDYDQAGERPWYAWGDDITTVVIGEGVTRIGDYAFQDFPLTSIQTKKAEAAQTRADGGSEPIPSALPEGLISIGKYALSNTHLTNLTLPSSLQRIDKFALFSNDELATLTFLATMSVPYLENDVFASCDKLTAIYVPGTCVDDYKNADCWGTYATLIKAIPEGGDEPGGDEPTEVSGSEVVSVGSVGYSSDYLPSYPQSEYSTSQQIYTKDEIGKAGKITSIAFYNYEMGKARSYDIYLSHTTKEQFDSNTDWITVSEANKVFTGTVTLGDGWTVIDFDTPFDYDGEQNLLLTVDDNTGRNTGSYHSVGVYSPSGHQALYYYKSTNLDPTQPITVEGDFRTSYSGDRKNGIQLCFETNPKPSRLEAVEVGDVSAIVQCSLRGNATAWNLRYRKVAKDGEEEQTWTVVNNLTDRSKTLEGLTPLTKYEAQVQAVFPEGVLSDWTNPITFVTNCCPVEQQAEIIYALNSFGRNWFGYGAQIVDVTDKDNPVEVAFLRAPNYQAYSGTITLCCEHKYKVNWIYDGENSEMNPYYSLAFYFEPGDEFFSMAQGEAPNKNAELTEFIMDCGDYCAAKPKKFKVESSNFNSVTFTFNSETTTGEFVYSTEAEFNPDEATPKSVTFDAVAVSDEPWNYEATPANSSLTLTGLESLTKYYVRVRSVCTDGDGGFSRWSDPVEVTTGSKYDAPGQVMVTNIDSRTVKISHTRFGGEKKSNVYYRLKAPGNPIDASALVTFGNVKANDEKGFNFDGKVTWSSYGYEQRPFSNVLYYPGIPAGSNVSFNVGNWNSKGGLVKFLWGFKKVKGKTPQEVMEAFDMECLSDADRAARIKELQTKIAETDDEEVKAKLQADIDLMNALPTDAQKLARMKELENLISNSTDEAEKAQYATELNNLRAMMSAAENDRDSGFSITREDNQANARTRGLDDGEYAFFIRHANDDGYLAARDFTLTLPENLNEWIIIRNISDTEYTLAGLKPGTTYEVMVEPVYEDGTTGTHSAITVFTTLGRDEDPMKGAFSVSSDKRVSFAKGNLRYEGDIYGMEAEWTMAPQQYDIFGEDNVNTEYDNTYPASPRDLFCWSNSDTRYGIYSYYYDSAEDTQQYFRGDFTDWGTNPKFSAVFGSGWSTLSKKEWTYLLTERENADKLKAFATVAGVKGLVLLPDKWDAPDGLLVKDEMTADEWTAIEQTGAVFLPAAGQMTAVYNPDTYGATTTYTPNTVYWTSTPADAATENALDFGCGLTFNETDVTFANVSRRTYTAVRLVKTFILMGDANGDDKVDAADIVEMVNAKNGHESEKFRMELADMDGDGYITDIDIKAVVNNIMTP